MIDPTMNKCLYELIREEKDKLKNIYSKNYDETINTWINDEACKYAIKTILAVEIAFAIKKYPSSKKHIETIASTCNLSYTKVNIIVASLTPGIKCDMEECIFQLCLAMKDTIFDYETNREAENCKE